MKEDTLMVTIREYNTCISEQFESIKLALLSIVESIDTIQKVLDKVEK